MDIKFYAMLAVLSSMIAIGAITMSPIAVMFASVSSAIAIVAYKLDYAVDSMVFRRTNLVQVLGECSLSGDRCTAVREHNGNFCATAAAMLNGKPSIQLSNASIESVISNAGCAFKLVLSAERINLKRLSDDLETERIKCEIALGKLEASGAPSDRVNAMKRRISLISSEIEAVSIGGQPLKLCNYILTSAISETKMGAQERAKSQIRELGGEFGAAMGCNAISLEGNELLELVKFNACV